MGAPCCTLHSLSVKKEERRKGHLAVPIELDLQARSMCVFMCVVCVSRSMSAMSVHSLINVSLCATE